MKGAGSVVWGVGWVAVLLFRLFRLRKTSALMDRCALAWSVVLEAKSCNRYNAALPVPMLKRSKLAT